MKIPHKKRKKVRVPGPREKEQFSTILGFRAISRPRFIETLEFPVNLTTLDAANVSDLHAKYSLLFSYANQRFTQVEVKILRLNQKRTETEISIFRDYPEIGGLDKWRKEAKVNTFDAILYVDRQLNIALIERRTLAGLKENYDKLIAALSRELSRRQFNARSEGF